MFNFALVGCGSMANWHAVQLRRLRMSKSSRSWTPFLDAAATFKEKYFNDAVAIDSYDQLLEQPPAKLDAVVLVTPHTLHYPQAKARFGTRDQRAVSKSRW